MESTSTYDRSGITQFLSSASEMENFAQGPLATTIPGGADWGNELPFPKTMNPFVQAGALSTDSLSLNGRENAIDGGVDQLKESCRFIPLCQILKATNDFDDALIVGAGGFGKVYKANIDDCGTTTVVAIKRLNVESNQGAEEFWTEVMVLSKFRHTNLISLIGYCNENQEMILVYEYIARGTLANHLYKTSTREESSGSRSHLTWEQRLNICLDAARGLDYLHNGILPGIIHRDVKSTNILLDEYLVAKVSDLGISKSMTTYLTTHVSTNVKGTFGYLDPDYFLTSRLTKKSDVYAFGVVLLEVLCGRPPLDLRLDEEQINLVNWAQMNIKKGKLDRIIDPSLSGDTTPHSLKYFAELANKCLRYQPKKRPTMAEVVESLKIALVSHERKGRSQGIIAKAWTLGSLFSRHRNPLLVQSPEIQKSSNTVNGGGKPTKRTTTAFLVANSKAFDDFEVWSKEEFMKSKETFMIHEEKLVKKEEGFTNEHLPDNVFAKSKKNKDNSKTVNKFYIKRGRGRWDSMELKHSATFQKLEMDPENKNNRAYQSGVLVSNSKKRKTIEALKRLQGSLVSILRLEDYDTPLPCQLTVLGMSKNIPGLLSICGDDQIVEPTTNHIHIDRVDVALLRPLNFDLYIHKSSPQPKASPDGGEIVLLDSSKQKPSVDFDATNNRAYQSDVLVSRRQCMPEGVLSLVDSTTRISSMNFDAPDNSAHLVRAYQSGPIVFNSEKIDTGEGLNRECLSKCALSSDDSTKPRSSPDFDATENKAAKVYTRQGRGCWDSMGFEQRTTLEELGMDPENEGIISDLLRFVRDKEELYKEAGRDWKKGYLLYDSPSTDRSSLIAAMANFLEFDIYDLDLAGLTSISELTNVLVSIRNRSLIAIKDFDRWFAMLPNLKNELMLSGLLKIIHGLLSSCGDERIIILTTNHNHIDSVDAALLRSLNIDLYIHTSSPQPKALPEGGEIVLLDSSEQKPSLDFYPTNRAYQSDVLVPNSKDKNTREASRRQCMPGRVLSLVDSTARISSTDFDASDNRVHLVRAYQSGPVVFNSEKKDTREVLSRECLTKSVLCLDDSSKQKSLLDVAVTEKKSHLVRAYPSGPVVSFSDDKNGGVALKRECITKSILRLEDLQQHSGGRRDAAAKSFCAIYDPAIHTADSLARISFEVLETLPTQEQPNDCLPLLSLGRLTLEDCVQQEKSPDLPRVTQINGLEQRVTKLPRYFGGLTAQSASSSRWPIGLPDGGRIVLLDPLDQSTKHREHVGRADQCSPTLSLPEKKMVRKTLKRKCRTMSVIIEDNHQHFARRCEGAAKSLGATHIFRKHGINQVSTVKQIKHQGIHQWPFFRQKWATRKGYSLGEERPFEVRRLSMDKKLDSRLQLIHMSQFARSSPQALTLPDGGEIVRPTTLSSSEFAATNNRAHLVGQDQSGSTASHYKCKNTRETSDKQGLEDLQQHFGCKHEHALKSLGVSGSMFKSTCKQHWFYWWLGQFKNNEQAFDATSNRAHLVKADERVPTVSNALSLEDLRHHFGARRKESAKGLRDSLAWKSFKVLDSLPLVEQSNTRRRSLTHKHCVQLKKSQDLPRSVLRDCSGGLTAQSDIGLPDGGHFLSEKKIVRKTLKRKCRTMSVLSLEDHQQHVGRRWEDTVKFLGAKRICRQLVIHRETTAKHFRRQLGTRQWLFKQFAIGLPDGGHILYLPEKKIVRKTLKRKCRSISVLSLEDHKQHVDRRWEDAVKSHGAKRIFRQLGIHRLSTAKRTHKQHGIHQWPFQRSTIGLPDGRHILPLTEKKMVRKTLKRKCRSMSVLSLMDRQHVDRRWEDTTKNIGAKRICRQLVIHRVSIAKRICRQHGIHHRWPFERDWATMKGYSLGDERPIEVISLSTHAKLVPRLQLIYISWLGRFSPRPSALAGGGEIGGPIALSLSAAAATKSIAQRVGQVQSGSAASDSENERTREQGDPEEINATITLDDIRRHYGRRNREDAAASLAISVATFKRKCREFGIKRWPHVRKRKVGRPPDQHGEENTSTTRETPSHHVQTGMGGEPVGQNQEANVLRQDFMGGPIALNVESGLIMVARPPDQHGEKNTSTACEVPSHNVETGMEIEPVGQNQEANVFQRDFTEGPTALNTGNGLIIGSSSEWASQVNDQSTLSTPYQNHNALVCPQPQIASMLSENRGGSIDWRDFLASQAEPFSDRHISGSSNGQNLAFPTWSDQAAPSQRAEGQSVQSTVYPDHNAVHHFPEGHVFESINWNEHTNSLASQAEPFSDKHISGSSNLAFPTWSDQAAPSQRAEGQSVQSTVYPDHNAVHRFPEGHVFESINWNEHTNSLASQAEPFSDRLISRSIWRPPDQLEGQTMQFTAHPNPNALGLPQFQIASSQVPSANEANLWLLFSQKGKIRGP